MLCFDPNSGWQQKVWCGEKEEKVKIEETETKTTFLWFLCCLVSCLLSFLGFKCISFLQLYYNEQLSA